MLSLTERHSEISARVRPWLKYSLMRWSIDSLLRDIMCHLRAGTGGTLDLWWKLVEKRKQQAFYPVFMEKWALLSRDNTLTHLVMTGKWAVICDNEMIFLWSRDNRIKKQSTDNSHSRIKFFLICCSFTKHVYVSAQNVHFMSVRTFWLCENI